MLAANYTDFTLLTYFIKQHKLYNVYYIFVG